MTDRVRTMVAVTDPAAPSALPRPGTAEGAMAFVVSPFARVARTHAASAMADAMVAASLAGSLFFTLPADGARVPVLRYLLITMLPFAVLSPLVGPLIDRMKGGHRLMVIGSVSVRAAACYFMAQALIDKTPLFFLYALVLLVCQRAYQVARSALVPTVVRNDTELVEANSKLSLISGLAGFVGVVPAAIVLKLAGPEWSLGLAMVVYLVAAALGTQIPRARVATESADETERHELRGTTIVMAGSAMGLIRACVGFLTLLVAFDFRGGGRPAWQFALVGAVSVLGQLAGAASGPKIRSITSEENLLTGVLALLVAGSLISLLLGDVAGAAILGACVGFAAGGGKLAFDSILQRDAPDANRGRAFARFETRFQVTWVIGALVPVAITIHAGAGFAVVFILASIALASYVLARLAYAHRMGTHQSAASAAAVEIEERLAEVSGEVKGRLASAPGAAIRRIRLARITGRDPSGESPPDEAGTRYVDDYDQVELGDDPASWPQPEWADSPGAVDPHRVTEVERPRRRGRHHRVAKELADPAVESHNLAADSSLAWQPPPDGTEYPWQPPPEPPARGDGYLDDLDPAVDNPYPWTPDPGKRP